jgi:hypothetical protein
MKLLLGTYLILSALVVAAVIYVEGARLYTGTPDIDCGGLEPVDCRAAMELFSDWRGSGSGPVTYFKIEPSTPGSTCGNWWAEKVEFVILGPLVWVEGNSAQPFC